jgi:hypothetical protein
VRTDRWKYIRRFDDYPSTVLSNCDDSATKEVLVEAGWGEQLVPKEQLYDLLLDPGEARNLADSASHGEALATMRARLEDWMRSTDDPILDGDVPAPVGAEINLPSQGSSREPRVFVSEDGSYVDSPPDLAPGALDEAEALRGQIR